MEQVSACKKQILEIIAIPVCICSIYIKTVSVNNTPKTIEHLGKVRIWRHTLLLVPIPWRHKNRIFAELLRLSFVYRGNRLGEEMFNHHKPVCWS